MSDNDINLTSVEFLLTDAGVGLTFVSIAETTTNCETKERNVRNARKAYDTIQRLRVRYILTEAQTMSLDLQLLALKTRLAPFSESF